MIVFADGAILRLGATVISGQCVKVTNLRTKGEMLCRVVAAKANPSGKPSVEMVFFNRNSGFWGVNFPEPLATQSRASVGARPHEHPSPRPAPHATAVPSVPVAVSAAPAPAIVRVPTVHVTEELPPEAAAAPSEVPTDTQAALPLADSIGKRELTLPLDPVLPVRTKEPALRAAVSVAPEQLEESRVSTGALGVSSTAEIPVVASAVLAEVPVHVREMTLLTREEAAPKRSSGPLVLGGCLLVLILVFVAYFWAGTDSLQDNAPVQRAANAFAQPAAPTDAASKPADQTVAVAPAEGSPSIEPTNVPVPTTTSAPLAAGQSSASNLTHAATASVGAATPAASSTAERESGAEPAPRKQLLGIRSAGPVPVTRSVSETAEPTPDVQMSTTPEANGGLGGLVKSGTSARVPAPPAPPPPAASGSEPGKAGSNLVLPRLKASVAPAFPLEARRNGIAGDVVLDTLITEKGKVTDIKVVSGPVLLRQAAVSAVQMWTYEPAKLNGQPIAMRLNVTIKFVR
jgi:TonB family protein